MCPRNPKPWQEFFDRLSRTQQQVPLAPCCPSPCASGLAMERGARGHQRYTLGEQEIKQDSGQRRISGVQLCRRRHRRRRCKHRPQRPRRAPPQPQRHGRWGTHPAGRKRTGRLLDACPKILPRFRVLDEWSASCARALGIIAICEEEGEKREAGVVMDGLWTETQLSKREGAETGSNHGPPALRVFQSAKCWCLGPSAPVLLQQVSSTARAPARHAPTTIANGLSASRSRAQTDGLHMRPPHYEAFFFLPSPSAGWAMAVVSGPTASIAGISPWPPACRAAFLFSSPETSLVFARCPDRTCGVEHPVRPIHIHPSFCKAPRPRLAAACFVPWPRCRRASTLSWTWHLDQMVDPREPLSMVQRHKGDEACKGQCRGTSGRPVTGPGRGHTTGGGKFPPWTMILATLRGSFVPSPEHLLKPASICERCGSTHAWGAGDGGRGTGLRLTTVTTHTQQQTSRGGNGSIKIHTHTHTAWTGEVGEGTGLCVVTGRPGDSPAVRP